MSDGYFNPWLVLSIASIYFLKYLDYVREQTQVFFY